MEVSATQALKKAERFTRLHVGTVLLMEEYKPEACCNFLYLGPVAGPGKMRHDLDAAWGADPAG